MSCPRSVTGGEDPGATLFEHCFPFPVLLGLLSVVNDSSQQGLGCGEIPPRRQKASPESGRLCQPLQLTRKHSARRCGPCSWALRLPKWEKRLAHQGSLTCSRPCSWMPAGLRALRESLNLMPPALVRNKLPRGSRRD